MDFFSLMLEHILDMVNQKFDFIEKPIIRGIAQIAAMLVVCVIFVVIIIVVAHIIRKIRGK